MSWTEQYSARHSACMAVHPGKATTVISKPCCKRSCRTVLALTAMGVGTTVPWCHSPIQESPKKATRNAAAMARFSAPKARTPLFDNCQSCTYTAIRQKSAAYTPLFNKCQRHTHRYLTNVSGIHRYSTKFSVILTAIRQTSAFDLPCCLRH